MFKLKKVVKITSRCFIKRAWRNSSNIGKIELKEEQLSVRQQLWRRAQEKYSNHRHIIYSSHLELQADHLDSKMRKPYENKLDVNKILKQHGIDEILDDDDDFPYNWMEDYEFFEGYSDDDDNKLSKYGTTDPTVPPSTVPCSGCGAHLHCSSTTLPGYIPKEIFFGRTIKELKTIVCQRCHFLEHYNIALDLEVTPESYVETISCIKNEFALAIVIVDLLDFPCSIWPGMHDVIGRKRPVFIVGNKVDLLPRDSNGYLDRVKQCLKKHVVQAGFDSMNIKNISLISAKTGYGIEELITQLQKIWLYQGDVYLLGCTNVGKSSLFNILLNSDYCRPEASELVRKATVCPWPGTTLKMLKFPIMRPSEIRIYYRFKRLFSEKAKRTAETKLRHSLAMKSGSMQAAKLIGHVGRTYVQHEDVADAFAMVKGSQPITTLNERRKEYQQARWCYDTPGVLHPDQITNLLTPDELMQLQSNQMLGPRAYRLKEGMSIFLAGLARLDLVKMHQATGFDYIKVLFFCSKQLPVVITNTADADAMYQEYLGTEILGVPFGSGERLNLWPGLQCKADELIIASVNDGEKEHCLSADITLSSAGWAGISLPKSNECTLKVWTPFARGIHMRTPALIPFAERLVGKRIQNSLAYNISKPFVFRK